MERIVQIIQYFFQYQREFFYSLLQFGIATIVFGSLYFLKEKLPNLKTVKVINLEAKQWKPLSILVLLPAIFLGLLFATKMPILGDEAVYTSISYGVAEGLIPYRDFAAHVPPFLFYIYGLFFKIAGTSILVARILSFTFFLLSLYLIYRIFASYSEKAYIPLAIFVALVILHPSDFSQFFYIGSKESFAFLIILLSLFFLKDNTKKCLFLAGVFVAFAILTKQTFLVLLPVCFLTIFAINYEKEGILKKEILFFLGFIIAIVPVLIFFLPYSQQAFHNLLKGLWAHAYFTQITQFPLISNRFEQILLSSFGWFLRHYFIFFVWLFLLVKFLFEFLKKESIFNIPAIILWPIIFILIFGISSLLFIPASLNRFLIIMNMFLYFSVASLVLYLLKEYQWNIKVKKVSLIFVFLILLFTLTNPKQVASYTTLDNSVITQYQVGANIGALIKSLPGYEEKQIVFLGSYQHLLAQGEIPASKIYSASYWGMKFWNPPFHKNLSLKEAQYYHYMTEKVFQHLLENKSDYIFVIDELVDERYGLSEKYLLQYLFLNKEMVSDGIRLYKVYY